MGTLQDSRTNRAVIVESELLVGRSAECGLRISQPYVSARHTTLRWTGMDWELKDLGSRNGTFVNYERLAPGSSRLVARDAKLAFGSAHEQWTFIDDSPPSTMVVATTEGEPLVAEHDVIGLPSSDNPLETVFRDRDGTWKLERTDGELLLLEHRQIFHAVGQSWRFSCADGIGSTTSTDPPPSGPVGLQFCVSRDEEHVAVAALLRERRIELGSRSHNYILLLLARARREDAAAGHSDAAAGWMYQEDLLKALRITQTQLNIDIFRMRQHFARAGLQKLLNVVERRPRSKQLRIGVRELTIEVE